MIKVTARYFLKRDSMDYFYKWYEKVSNLTSAQDGFVHIRCETQSNPIVYLYFENKEKLSAWAATDAHDNLASEIETYFIESQEVHIEEVTQMQVDSNSC
jgi:heme-degrading monooxygenase HmoA